MNEFLGGVICGIFLCPVIATIFGMTVSLVKELFKKPNKKEEEE